MMNILKAGQKCESAKSKKRVEEEIRWRKLYNEEAS